MAHVGRPSALELSTRRRETGYLPRDKPSPGHTAGAGRGLHHAKLSPTNIKTNPNYYGGQRSPIGGEKDRSLGAHRARSLVVLGTSSTGNKQRKHEDTIANNKDEIPAQLRFHATPRPRGLSNPDIAQKLTREIRPRRPRGHSASDILDDDLDLPEYKRGLSSPDLNQGDGRKLKQAKGKSASLDVLRRSHDCLRTGHNGTCRCSVPLYKPDSSADLSQKRAMRSGSVDHGTGMVGKPRYQPLRKGGKNISDSDVSSFFTPSPMAWKHGSRNKLDQSQSVDTNLDAHVNPMCLLRPNHEQIDRKPERENSINSNLSGECSNIPLANGEISGTRDAPTSSVKRSTSLPCRPAWQTSADPTADVSHFYSRHPPPKPPRFMPENMRRNKIAERREPVALQRVSTPLFTRPISTDGTRPTSRSTDFQSSRTPLTKNTFGPAITSASSSLDPSQPTPSGSHPSLTQPPDSKMTRQVSTDSEPSSPEGCSEPAQPMTSTPSCSTMLTSSHDDDDTTPLNLVAPTATTKRLEYKPLYHEMMDPTKRWFTSYDRGERGNVASTYFAAREPGLGRDISSYKYSNKDDKAKVLALLDRYAASGRSNLGLSREQMANYLNCTKRQLGMDGPNALEDNSNPVDGAQNEENKANSNLKSDITRVKSSNSQIGADKENVNPNNNNHMSGLNDTQPESHFENKPPSKTKLSNDRSPSIIPLNAVKNETGNAVRSRVPLKAKINTMPKDTGHGPAPPDTCEGSEVLMLPQTTFHVDGGITETPAIRRRTLLDQRSTFDDVNNNDNESDRTNGLASGPLSKNKAREPTDGVILHTVQVPCYRMYRSDGALHADGIPEELLKSGITAESYQQIRPLLNHSVQCHQFLGYLQLWSGGTCLAIMFLLVWLLGVLVAYFIGVAPLSGAVLMFVLCILVLCGVVWGLRNTKHKVENNLRITLMRANAALKADHIAAVVTGKTLNLQGTTLHLTHFDAIECQACMGDVLADKGAEDLLLTEISRKYPSLMEMISSDLQCISTSQDDIGKEAIITDSLMYFVSPYLDDFLRNDKKFASNGSKTPISHPQSCLCKYVGNIIGNHLSSGVNDSSTVGAKKLSSSKPTLL